MFELSLHILDLVQNAISAGASLVEMEIVMDESANKLTITLTDDGCGMDAALTKRVCSPFATTRTTRKVGLGIPMFTQLAQQCGGGLSIDSKVGQGTRLSAWFQLKNIDLPPMGDLRGTLCALILGAPDKPDFVLDYRVNDQAFVFDTRQIRALLGGVGLNEPDVLGWIGEYITEGIAEVDPDHVLN